MAQSKKEIWEELIDKYVKLGVDTMDTVYGTLIKQLERGIDFAEVPEIADKVKKRLKERLQYWMDRLEKL